MTDAAEKSAAADDLAAANAQLDEMNSRIAALEENGLSREEFDGLKSQVGTLAQSIATLGRDLEANKRRDEWAKRAITHIWGKFFGNEKLPDEDASSG